MGEDRVDVDADVDTDVDDDDTDVDDVDDDDADVDDADVDDAAEWRTRDLRDVRWERKVSDAMPGTKTLPAKLREVSETQDARCAASSSSNRLAVR